MNTIKYKEYTIEATRGGWFVVFIPDYGFLKADTLSGAKQMINQYNQGKKNERR